MFVSHENILHIQSGDLSDKVWQERMFPIVFPDGDSLGRWPIVLRWLMLLPHSKKVEKIIDSKSHYVKTEEGEVFVRGGLRAIIREEGGELTNLQWWDIDLRKRHLMAMLRRGDGLQVPVLFLWKKRPPKDSAERQHAPPGHAAWEFDSDMANPARSRWRYAIEGETIDHVKKSLVSWLAKKTEDLEFPDTFRQRNAAA